MTTSKHKVGCWHYEFDVRPVIFIQRWNVGLGGNERRYISKEMWDGTTQQRLREEGWLPTDVDPRTVCACRCAEISDE